MSMRLALVVDSDAFGGAEVYARQLLRRAPATVDRVLLTAEPVAQAFAGPDRVRVLPVSRHHESAPALGAALEEVAPDVVHVNLVDPASNRAALRAATACAPTVVTLHLQGSLGEDEDGLRQAYAGVAAALAPSVTIADQLRGDLGLAAEDVHRVRNGVDIPQQAVAPRPVADRRVVVGAVGRLTEQKGLDVLIEAVRRVDPAGRRLRVVIAGSGRDEAALRQQADGLPVRFVGQCTDVPALLRTLDVFALPSRREALSLALLEAMAHGLPSISTAVGDTVEAVGEDALVVPVGDADAVADALDRLVRDVDLRVDLGRRARLRAVRDFDAQRMVTQSVQVMASAAGRRLAA